MNICLDNDIAETLDIPFRSQSNVSISLNRSCDRSREYTETVIVKLCRQHMQWSCSIPSRHS